MHCSSYSRRQQNIEEAAHVYNIGMDETDPKGNVPLSEAIKEHAYLRCQQIVLDMIRIHGMGQTEDAIHCHVYSAHEQGPSSQIKGWQAAHNSPMANVRENFLIQKAVTRVRERQALSPEDKRLLQVCYHETEEQLLEKILSNQPLVHRSHSLFHGRHSELRQHCTLLPRYVNLTVDARLEKHLRNKIAENYSAVATGAAIGPKLKSTIHKMHAFHVKAAKECEERIEQLHELNREEKRLLSMFVEAKAGKEENPELENCIKRIKTLQESLNTHKDGAPRYKATLSISKSALAQSKYRISELWKWAASSNMTANEAIYRKNLAKREAKIADYQKLQHANELSAEGTQIPNLKYLIPSAPQEQKEEKARMLDQRPKGASTPERFDRDEMIADLPTPLRPEDFDLSPGVF